MINIPVLSMWTGLQRWWLRRKVPEGAMHDYLAHPLPPRHADVRDLEFIALDLETTGLDPKEDEIVSVGYVLVREGRVCLKTARHRLVRIEGSVAQSAALHGLVDDQLAEGALLDDVLAEFLDTLAGRVLLLHHAPFDLGFLNAACQRRWGVPLNAYVVDTLALARQRHYQSRQRPPRKGELRLHALRERYGLPRYPAHDALSDALATAELFLAITAHGAGGGRLPLGTLL